MSTGNITERALKDVVGKRLSGKGPVARAEERSDRADAEWRALYSSVGAGTASRVSAMKRQTSARAASANVKPMTERFGDLVEDLQKRQAKRVPASVGLASRTGAGPKGPVGPASPEEAYMNNVANILTNLKRAIVSDFKGSENA